MHEAVALGVDGLEFDVHVTRDGVPVVHHDATLNRTTNATGPIVARTLAELRDVDAGYHFRPVGGRDPIWRGRGVRVPTLDAVLESFPTLPLIIEIKTPQATAAARACIARHAAERRVIVAGFDAASVKPLTGGPIPLGACTADLVRALPYALLGLRGPAMPFVAACVPPRHHGLPVPLRGYARLLHAHGGVIHVWTVNTPVDAQRYWALGVNGLISDDPAALLALRDG